MHSGPAVPHGAYQGDKVSNIRCENVIAELRREHHEVSVHHIGTAGPLENVADSCRIGMLEWLHVHGSEEPDQSDLS